MVRRSSTERTVASAALQLCSTTSHRFACAAKNERLRQRRLDHV